MNTDAVSAAIVPQRPAWGGLLWVVPFTVLWTWLIYSLPVLPESGLPALDAIAGVSVHKFLWFDMQSIQLKQNQGQKVIRVVTSGGAKEFAVA